MNKQIIVTDQAGPPGGPYSQAVVAGNLVFCAGSTPTHPDGTRVEGGFEAQARATFENLKVVAEAAGTSLDHALRVGVYLRDFSDFEAMNVLFAEYFGGSAPPARTTLEAPLPGFAIEIDAVLLRGE